MTTPRVSVVIPAYNEGDAIIPHLRRILESVDLPCEIIVVVDTEDDTTLPPVRAFMQQEPCLRAVVSTYGRGPARAIRPPGPRIPFPLEDSRAT